MNLHTKGPWAFYSTGAGSFAIHTEKAGAFFEFIGFGAGTKANAHLIAAAPDMLEALKALVDDHEVGNWSEYKMDAALAAIAKAEGRA